MCSPEVMALVAQRMGRRELIRAGAAGGLAAAVAGIGRGTVRAQDASPVAEPGASPVAALPSGFSSVVDLTHTWGPEFPVYPGAQQAEFQTLVTVADNGFFKMQLTLDEHTGTHMDAPAHFVTDGMSADQLPVERFVAPLVVIHIHERAASDPDTQGTVDDLTAWESANGPIPDGAFVALHSGWESRLSDPASFINQDASGVQHYPGWHPDAAAFLVNERTITGAGVDTLSLDFGASTDFGSHLTFLPAGKFGLENLANLANVPPAGATIIVGGPKHRGASGGPTRALALV